MKILYLPIKNITVDSFCNLKDSFKVRQVPNKTFLNYYDTVYIENPFDNDCSKLLITMKSKIYYNFLNEHVLLANYLNDCNYNKILKEAIIKYHCNSTQLRYVNQNEDDFVYKDKFQGNLMPVILIFILLGIFTFNCIFYMILKEIRKNYETKLLFQNNRNKKVRIPVIHVKANNDRVIFN
jgi:hypothetical protein